MGFGGARPVFWGRKHPYDNSANWRFLDSRFMINGNYGIFPGCPAIVTTPPYPEIQTQSSFYGDYRPNRRYTIDQNYYDANYGSAHSPDVNFSQYIDIDASQPSSNPTGSAYGPALYLRNRLSINENDKLSFWWRQGTIFGKIIISVYLIDPDQSCKSIILLDYVGPWASSSTDWAKVEKTFSSGESGNYYFVCMLGSVLEWNSWAWMLLDSLRVEYIT